MVQPAHTIIRRFRGLLFTLLVVGVGGSFVSTLVLQNERRIQVRERTVQTAGVISGFVRADLETLVRSLTDIARSKVREVPAEASATRALEMDRDLLDIELWTWTDGDPKPRRTAQAMNVRDVTPAQELILASESSERLESPLIESAFQGRIVLVPSHAELVPSLILAVPPIPGSRSSEILVAHLSPSRFQKSFRVEGSIRAALVSNAATVFAHSGGSLERGEFESLHSHPLVQAFQNDLGVGSGQLDFEDSRGNRAVGAYARISPFQLAVIVSVPESEAQLSWSFSQNRGIELLGILFLLATCGGFAAARARGLSVAREGQVENTGERTRPVQVPVDEPSVVLNGGPDAFAEKAEGLPQSEPPKAEQRIVTVLHGSMTQVNQLLDSLGPEVAMTALNEFLTQASNRIRESAGSFERGMGATFIAFWDGEEACTQAVRCALELRRDFAKFNAVRRLDGEKPLALRMGVDTGLALAGKIGPASDGRFSIVGEVLACARKLDQLSESGATDLLVSEDTWEPCRSRFFGSPAGESKLTAATGLKPYFSVQGYRDDAGAEVLVPSGNPPPVTGAAPAETDDAKGEQRWLVNNGSKIDGPWSAQEISARLFAQELDFDCECWIDGTGKPAQLSNIGLFGPAPDAGAEYWVYDRQVVHGPMTSGFLRTALQRGAMPRDWMVCRLSTVNGWKPLYLWEEGEKSAAAAAESPPVKADSKTEQVA